ncbi:MerR family transcriptional regulator [Novosphingobium sp. JCM 18896]|uniref:MerR family transcriptional regulator n=1 Tax=Novosphingobium sp. JCM 18896 TaxID=2989731 RepID=UPI0022233941|nr:MerR family transcriptional regulator [Novosphingobium sp. JCM 18896]MCW1427970.1 MerR family transcriptional regulator [Novosphingobium sp. JCM 18896]
MNEQSNFPGFDDGKAPDALRTIGEVAAALNIRQHVLRYWEEQFPMLKPIKRSGGRRYYRPEDIQLVATIDRLVHKQGYTLRGARLAIEGGEGKAAAAPAKPVTAPAQASADLLPQLQSIRNALAAALAAA